MRIKATVVFTFDTGDETLESMKAYLKDCPGECLDWIGEDVEFTFEEVK